MFDQNINRERPKENKLETSHDSLPAEETKLEAQEPESFISPEEQAEVEKRKEVLEEQKEKIIKEEELSAKEQETVEQILEEARKTGPMFTLPNREAIASRLVKAITEGGQKLSYVIHAIERFGDPFLFDSFKDELTKEENWIKLQELKEI